MLRLGLAKPDSADSVKIQFDGVYGWHLDDAVSGCIVSRLAELRSDEYLTFDSKYVEAMQNQCFATVVDAVRNGDGRVWQLDSSYGLSGYIIAQELHETS